MVFSPTEGNNPKASQMKNYGFILYYYDFIYLLMIHGSVEQSNNQKVVPLKFYTQNITTLFHKYHQISNIKISLVGFIRVAERIIKYSSIVERAEDTKFISTYFLFNSGKEIIKWQSKLSKFSEKLFIVKPSIHREYLCV